jgi:putative phosphoribosyl transferase
MDIFIHLPNNEFLQATLNMPSNPKSLVIFAHGSGSSVSSPRNKFVSEVLNNNGFATLLADLLTEQEQESDIKSQKIMGKYPGIVLNKFNINLLSDRLKIITRWIVEKESNDSSMEKLKDLQFGYFGASTGAAAAIEASSDSESNLYSDRIYAIVSRGGRPDLSGSESLKSIKAATLFIVGEKDDKEIISLNKKAFKQLKNAKHKDFVIIPKAGHLFDEEPGMLEKVAEISLGWINRNLKK